MLVVGFPAGPWQTNCWVVAPAEGEECVVIDPGHGAEGPLDEVLAQHRLRPVAVLLSHGHVDHIWSVVPVCGAKNVPALISPKDRDMLTDPGVAIGAPPGTPILGRLDWSEPDDVRELRDGETLELAGLQFRVDETPGHTPGSVTFEHVVQRLLGAVPGVDDDALLAGGGRDDPAVGLPGSGGKSDDEHAASLPRHLQAADSLSLWRDRLMLTPTRRTSGPQSRA